MQENDINFQPLSFGRMAVRTLSAAAKNYAVFFVSNMLATGVIFIVIAAMLGFAVPQLSHIIWTGGAEFSLEFIWVFTAGSILLTLISVFFTQQFSTGLVFAVMKNYENGQKVSLGGAFSLAKSRYKSMTLTLLAVMLCSLGAGAAAIPLGIVAIIPVIGILAMIGISYTLEMIFSFSLCAAAADEKQAFGAIKFGAAAVFYGGFFKTLLHLFVASVVMGTVIAVFSFIAVPVLTAQNAFGEGAVFIIDTWYIVLAAFWLLTSAVSPFFNVFVYYLYANARIRSANKAYEKMIQLQNSSKESWEAYKQQEAEKRWEELRRGCHVFEKE